METFPLLCVLMTLVSADSRDIYRGNQVLRVNIETTDDLKWLIDLEKQNGENDGIQLPINQVYVHLSVDRMNDAKITLTRLTLSSTTLEVLCSKLRSTMKMDERYQTKWKLSPYDAIHIASCTTGTCLITCTLYHDDINLSYEKMRKLDFWSALVLNKPADIMVFREYVAEFKAKLEERHLFYQVLKYDVQEDVDRVHRRSKRGSVGELENNIASFQDFDYTVYHTYDEIQQWISDAASEYEFADKFSLGTTYEGRDMGGLKISAPPHPSATIPKPIVYFEGGLHAREWIAPATIIYFAAKLMRQYANGDDDARQVLGMFDLHIIPSANGDGYVFTWTNERLWRKSRKPNPGFGCVGTDLNRNFENFWGGEGEGSSPWPCSLLFRGFSAFDNNETRAIDNHFQNLKANNLVTKVFIDWHNWDQTILAPWSYKSGDPPTESEDQLAAAQAMANAMTATNDVPEGYKAGIAADLLYEMTGSSNDYGFAGTPNAKYSYVVELRDRGQYAFLIPEEQIQPSGEESYNGVIALLQWIITNDY